MSDEALPEGFARHFKQSPFTDPWEPLYSRVLAEEVQIGVHVLPAHCNSRGFVHGAFLTALADNATGLSIGTTLAGRGFEVGSLVTTHLSVDFLGMARIGEWLQTETTVLKAGRTLCVASGVLRTPSEIVARVDATFMNRRVEGA